jgi:hypothetical protein
MNESILVYGDLGQGEITEKPSSFSNLKNRLEQIQKEYNHRLNMPYGVDLVREGKGRLSIGLGENEWMLFYYSEDGEVILNSLGDQEAEGTVLFYFGDHTELSRKYLIPSSDAWKVVRTWFEKGVLSDAIKWTEEIF